jgi:uncharacterized protein (DUF488 family)
MEAVVTVGHGAAAAEDFGRLLIEAGVGTVVDVRRFPGSRRHPQFGRDAMAGWLDEAGLGYRWVPALGGRRRGAAGSPNLGLREPAFRAYADHMATAEFAGGVAELLAPAEGSEGRRVAVMCAESVWWRCHRRLIADHLVLVEGRTVEHLFHDGRLDPHRPTPEARGHGDIVVYDVGTQGSLLDP